MILLVILGVFIALVAVIVGRVLYLSSPTSGPVIRQNQNPKSALVVLDVQQDTMSAYVNADDTLQNINAAIHMAEEQQMPVLYVRQEYSTNPIDTLLSGGRYQAHSEGADLAAGLKVTTGHHFTKLRSDTFSVSEFQTYLQTNQIDTLFLVGADAGACVYKTAIGGIKRGYTVLTLQDCLFSAAPLASIIEIYESAGVEAIFLADFGT